MNGDAAICHICGKEFDNKKYCNRHIKNIHKINTKGEEIPNIPAPKVLCVLCQRQFSQKSALHRHVNTVHNPQRIRSETELQCDKCDFKTIHKSNLRRHLVKMHGSQRTVKDCSIPKFKCSVCSAKYNCLRNLKYHEKKKHKIGMPSLPIRRECPLCKYTSFERKKELMYTHFKMDHGIVLNWESHSFGSVSDFNAWKEKIEKENISFYVKRLETKTSLHFMCHRSGNYIKKGANIRRSKSIGSCKINGFCPSAIKAKIESGNVHVLYLPVHVGHSNDPKYLRPPVQERKHKQPIVAGKKMQKENLPENAVLVAVNENNDISKVGEDDRNSDPEMEENNMVGNNCVIPNSYNEDQDTMLYLEKVKLFQEFRDFEAFLQKNVTSFQQIDYVRTGMAQIVASIGAMNTTLNNE